MSDQGSEIVVLEQRGGSPLRREVDAGGRTGRGTDCPSDPSTTPSDGEDQELVDRGGRGRDTAAGSINDGNTAGRSSDRQRPFSPPAVRQQQ